LSLFTTCESSVFAFAKSTDRAVKDEVSRMLPVDCHDR
jgi:hypothetical protein